MRPRDLPQPVRHHASHDVRIQKGADSPGPGAYSLLQTRSTYTGGAFSKASRFRYGDSSLQGGDYGVHPGPCYQPTWSNTKLGIAFKGTTSASRTAASSTPGPGAYDMATTPSAFGTAITFAKSKRASVQADAAPGPDAYTPARPPHSRKPVAFFGTSKRSFSASGIGSVHDDESTRAEAPSLESMDRAMHVVRPAVCASIRIPLSARREHKHNEIGCAPGSYNVCDSYTRPEAPKVSFGHGPAHATQERPVAYAAQLSTGSLTERALSTKPAAPAVGFGRATRGELHGKRDSSYTSSLAQLSQVSFQQVDPQVKLCTTWKPPSRPTSATSRSEQGPSYISPPSTLSGPAIAFPKSKRPELAAAAASVTPGPGEYAPARARRPESASQSIGRARRDITFGTSTTACDGIGDTRMGFPTVAAVRPTAPAITIARPSSAPSSRGKVPVVGADVGSYNPSYSHVDRHAAAAVLYLTG